MTQPTQQYWTPDPALIARTSNPDRRHDAQGIGSEIGSESVSTRDELYQSLVEFAADCASPDCYGHALPVEVVKRASRLVRMSEANRKPGYCMPPPVRCEKCENE